MSTLLRELRVALRLLRKSPSTTLFAILVLALGIGANSAMFNLVNILALRPLAVPEPERLVTCLSRNQETGRYRGFSYPNYLDLRQGATAFEGLTAHTLAMVGIEEEGLTRRAFIDLAAANYFQTLGVAPILGRAFLAAEEAPGSGAQVAILSHGLFERRGGRPEILGQAIELNGLPFTVIGVAPPHFGGTTAIVAPDLWVPLGVHELLENDFNEGAGRPLQDRENHALFLVGRLRPETHREQAGADVARVAANLRAAFPAANEEQTFEVRPLSRLSISTEPSSGNELLGLSALLLALASVLLLVAGLNLAAIQGARGLARRREIAVRLALGGGRLQVIRQLLVEVLLLALAGGAGGLALAWAVPRILTASILRLAPVQIMARAEPDVRVMAATLFFCVVATLIAGLAPALRATRTDLAVELKDHPDRPAPRGGRSLISRGDLPVLLEIACSMVLLVAAGLFLKGALAGSRIEPGFSLEKMILVELDPSFIGYDEQRGRAVYQELRERLSGLPGVESVALAATVPFGMVSLGERVEPVVGGESHKPEEALEASYNAVSRGYFETLEIPLLRGRTFAEHEAGAVAVIDRVLAERLWPDKDPLGRHLRILSDDSPSRREVEVVGVVGTIQDSLFERQKRAHLWLPFEHRYLSNAHLHVRFREGQGAEEALRSVRSTIRRVDERLPLLSLLTMEQHLAGGFELWILRTGARLFAVFAGVALVLTVAGVYGVRAYSVARRTREIGIRTALGASLGDNQRMILKEGLRLALLGSALGLLLSAGAARLLASFLYNVSAADPAVFLGSFALLLLVTLVACLPPARRAARLDPLAALRSE